MKEVLLSLLRLTKEGGNCSLDDIRAVTRVTYAEVQMQVERLSDMGLLKLGDGEVMADPEQRLGLAVKALGEGADLEKICRLLNWQEFEEIAVKALEANGFSTFKHFSFESDGARRQIDVVGVGQMLVICLDCKRWRRGLRGAAAREVVAKQVERARSLASNEKARARLNVSAGAMVYFVPVVVGLADASPRFISGVPIVPVLKLNSFLSSIDPFVEGLFTIKVKEQSGQA